MWPSLRIGRNVVTHSISMRLKLKAQIMVWVYAAASTASSHRQVPFKINSCLIKVNIQLGAVTLPPQPPTVHFLDRRKAIIYY